MSEENEYIEKDFLFKIENGIWKGFYIQYPSTLIYLANETDFNIANSIIEEDIKFHPTILNKENEVIAKTSYNGQAVGGELYYNHTSRRVELYNFNFKTMTARYKSDGHWNQYDPIVCINEPPYIIPTNFKSKEHKYTESNVKGKIKIAGAQIKNRINTMYAGTPPKKFVGILDYKRWGENEELFLCFTDNATLERYMLKVLNRSEYRSEKGDVDFINIPTRSTLEIHTLDNYRVVPIVDKAIVLSDKPILKINKSILKEKTNQIILDDIDAVSIDFLCPSCKEEIEVFSPCGEKGLHIVRRDGSTEYRDSDAEIINIVSMSDGIKETIEGYEKQFQESSVCKKVFENGIFTNICPSCKARITDSEAIAIARLEDEDDFPYAWNGQTEYINYKFGLLSGDIFTKI